MSVTCTKLNRSLHTPRVFLSKALPARLSASRNTVVASAIARRLPPPGNFPDLRQGRPESGFTEVPSLLVPPPAALQRVGQRTALLTGATSHGIGKEVLRGLDAAGWKIVSVARPSRVAEHASEFANVDVRACDCSSLNDVKRLAADLQADERYPHIDLMVHSLGVMRDSRTETSEGLEMNLVVNAISPWLLTSALSDKLAASGDARVVQVSSSGLALATPDVNDLQMSQAPYENFQFYFTSKLVNLHLMLDLQDRYRESNKPVTINLVHPGFVSTELGRDIGSAGGFGGALMKGGAWVHHNVVSISAAEAAKPVLAVATEPRYHALGGAYLAAPAPLKRLGATLQGRSLGDAVVTPLKYDASVRPQVVEQCRKIAGI